MLSESDQLGKSRLGYNGGARNKTGIPYASRALGNCGPSSGGTGRACGGESMEAGVQVMDGEGNGGPRTPRKGIHNRD